MNEDSKSLFRLVRLDEPSNKFSVSMIHRVDLQMDERLTNHLLGRLLLEVTSNLQRNIFCCHFKDHRKEM